MSSYTTASIELQPTLSPGQLCTQALRAALGSPSSWIASTDLIELRGDLAGVDDMTSAAGLINAVPGASKLIDQVRLSPQSVGVEGLAGLDLMLGDAIAQVRVDERRVVAAIIEDVLGELCWEVIASESDGQSRLMARRGDAVVAAEVNDGGDVAFDFAGLCGTTCDLHLRELLAGIEPYGLRLSLNHIELHRNPSGGPLIERTRSGSGQAKRRTVTSSPRTGARGRRSSVAEVENEGRLRG